MATIATTINGHRATTQKEIFQSEFSGSVFSSCYFSQAFEDRHFTKREWLFRHATQAFLPEWEREHSGRYCSAPCAWRSAYRLGLRNWHCAAVVVSSSKYSLG